jgi:hypothetical protein
VQVFRQHSSTLRYVLGLTRAGSDYLNGFFASIKHGLLLPISPSSLLSSLQATAWLGSAPEGLDDAVSARGKLKARPFETKAAVEGVESRGDAAAICAGEHKARKDAIVALPAVSEQCNGPGAEPRRLRPRARKGSASLASDSLRPVVRPVQGVPPNLIDQFDQIAKCGK